MLKRLATMAAFGAVAGLPLASPASAGPEVVFTAEGVPGVLCGSKPSTSSITVGANANVSLTNNLGTAANLKIDGATSAEVGAGQSVEVKFHHGPVSITMVQTSCLLPGEPKALTVQVTAAPPPAAQPSPTRPAPAPAQPSKPSTKPSPSTNTQQTPAAALPSLPPDPLFTDEALLASGTPAPGGATLGSPPATVLNSGNGPENVASSTPIDRGPIGLLAIIATVCVVGVTAGAIRAIITQRATRAEFA